MRRKDAGRLASSARNPDPRHFIKVTTYKKGKVLAMGLFAKFVAQAPLEIVVCGDKKSCLELVCIRCIFSAGEQAFSRSSTRCTHIVDSFNEKGFKVDLKTPENFEGTTMITVGYPWKNRIYPANCSVWCGHAES